MSTGSGNPSGSGLFTKREEFQAALNQRRGFIPDEQIDAFMKDLTKLGMVDLNKRMEKFNEVIKVREELESKKVRNDQIRGAFPETPLNTLTGQNRGILGR